MAGTPGTRFAAGTEMVTVGPTRTGMSSDAVSDDVVPPTTDAVTRALPVVDSAARASPLPSLMAELGVSTPASVVKLTGTPASRFPDASLTIAVNCTTPPAAGRADGLASSSTFPAAAAPTVTASGSPDEMPPENARTSAVPDLVPARSFATALPLLVRASFGSMVPSVVVKFTTVPFWTGVPDDSMTVAVMSTDPFRPTVVLFAYSVIVDSVGADRGILSQDARPAAARQAASPSAAAACQERLLVNRRLITA